jgi:ubiquinone/menaquinone biosynthesis C-methylase UbiE
MALTKQRSYDTHGFQYEGERYGAAHMRAYGDRRCEALLRIARDAFPPGRPLTMLEVGCGTGISVEFLARQPEQYSLYGVDFSRTMLTQAIGRCARLDNAPRFVLASGFGLPFPDRSFDLVYATRFIHQFGHDGKKQIYSEMMRVLRPGGVVAVEFYAFWYHWARYYLSDEHRRKPRRVFFEHYPTARQVRDIAGRGYESLPLRLAGARVLHSVCGESAVRGLTALVGRMSLQALVDEYLVITRK